MQMALEIPGARPTEPAGVLGPDEVAVFIASRSGRHTCHRVLWIVAEADARVLCDDPRTAGRNFMLSWTRQLGAEGETWRWVEDKGSFDGVLAELGVRPVRKGER
ncbi:hypothetical protein [Streptomyces albogriseolus]|uniref:hypothetical protein n=1 Tax=Streptomyces albogriseolus TaxID=1887 RepID=UPI00346138D5